MIFSYHNLKQHKEVIKNIIRNFDFISRRCRLRRRRCLAPLRRSTAETEILKLVSKLVSFNSRLTKIHSDYRYMFLKLVSKLDSFNSRLSKIHSDYRYKNTDGSTYLFRAYFSLPKKSYRYNLASQLSKKFTFKSYIQNSLFRLKYVTNKEKGGLILFQISRFIGT